MALRYLLQPPAARRGRRRRGRAAPPADALPERFAVRKRGKEIMVEVADIDWIEAAGNYAVLHVGGETLEIRSSLTKLEGELDPKRFVQSPQILRGQRRAHRRGHALDQRRLAHPPAGRRRGEPEPPLSPALRGPGAGQELGFRTAGLRPAHDHERAGGPRSERA